MEEGYFPTKMKRKGTDDVYEALSDFSLASPAQKIRRLDAELAPIIEEGAVNPAVLGQSEISHNPFVEQAVGGGPVAVDKLSSSVPENEERAIVLFNPINHNPLLQSRLPFSISVDTDLISGFKNPVLWSNRSNLLKPSEGESGSGESGSGCLAIVPWVAPQAEVCEMMDADDTEAATMDVEDTKSAYEGLNQWQQHCLIPQPPHNLSTPIAWSRCINTP